MSICDPALTGEHPTNAMPQPTALAAVPDPEASGILARIDHFAGRPVGVLLNVATAQGS